MILRCIEKDPELRYGSVAALSAALAPFAPAPIAGAASFPGSGAAPLPASVAALSEPKKAPVMAFVAGGVAVLIVMVVAFGIGIGGGKGPPPVRYKLESDTVVDTETKLTWQRRPAPAAMDWSSANVHCARAGKGLRLPEVEELKSLLAILSVEPPIDPASFTSTPIDVYWSATEAGAGAAMAVHFSTKHAASSTVSQRNRVRCVK